MKILNNNDSKILNNDNLKILNNNDSKIFSENDSKIFSDNDLKKILNNNDYENYINTVSIDILINEFNKKVLYNLNLSKSLNKFYEKFEYDYLSLFKNIKEQNTSDTLYLNKILIIMACHTDSMIKVNTIINNISYFNNIDLIVINSSNTSFEQILNEKIKNNIKNYITIDNDKYSDVGKWIYYLENFEYQSYEHIVFTNDSFIITNEINHFFNLIIKKNVEIFGYNDSSQCNYHFQSFLFSIKKESVYKFINFYLKQKPTIFNYDDLIQKIELQLLTIFEEYDCFLKIAYLHKHYGLNINFTNDNLFIKLLQLNLLPFYKIKRLKQYF